MKNRTRELINMVFTYANPDNISDLEGVISAQEILTSWFVGKSDEYQKVCDSLLEEKKDEQGTPIMENGVVIKFMPPENKQKYYDAVADMDIDADISWYSKVIKTCIEQILPKLNDTVPVNNPDINPAQYLFEIRKGIVELYKSL